MLPVSMGATSFVLPQQLTVELRIRALGVVVPLPNRTALYLAECRPEYLAVTGTNHESLYSCASRQGLPPLL